MFFALAFFSRTEKRYLIVSDVQLILVEPSPRKIGWGTVTFAGLLQVIFCAHFTKPFYVEFTS